MIHSLLKCFSTLLTNSSRPSCPKASGGCCGNPEAQPGCLVFCTTKTQKNAHTHTQIHSKRVRTYACMRRGRGRGSVCPLLTRGMISDRCRTHQQLGHFFCADVFSRAFSCVCVGGGARITALLKCFDSGYDKIHPHAATSLVYL